MARAIVAALGTIEPGSAAEALQHLHGAFPQAPLNVRTAALDHMMQHQWQFDS